MTCFEHLAEIARGHLAPGVDVPDLRATGPLGSPELLRLQARHLDLAAVRRLAQRLAAEQLWNCPTLVTWQQLAEPDEAALLATVLARGREPTWMTEAELRAVVRGRWLYGRWLADQAHRAGLPVLAPRPWATLAARIVGAAAADGGT